MKGSMVFCDISELKIKRASVMGNSYVKDKDVYMLLGSEHNVYPKIDDCTIGHGCYRSVQVLDCSLRGPKVIGSIPVES